MPASAGLAFIAVRLTGVFKALDGATSTATNRPAGSLGSMKASRTTLAMPTISSPTWEW